MIIKSRPALSHTTASTLALLLLINLFIIAWMAILYVASELFPEPNVRLLISELWVGKSDIMVGLIGAGIALTLYLNLKNAFNRVLWVPILMTVSVLLSSFTAGYMTHYARQTESQSLSVSVILLALAISIALMILSLRLYKKTQY